MDIDELQHVLAQGPASLRVESYTYFGSSMTVSLDFGRGASLTVGFGFCAQFSGAFQGKRERLSVETSDEGGWNVVGDTTLITFGRLIGRSAERAPEALAVAPGAPERFPPQPTDLDGNGVRKPYDEASLNAYFAASPVHLQVSAYQMPGWGAGAREMTIGIAPVQRLDHTLLILRDVTFLSGLHPMPDVATLRRLQYGFELAVDDMTVRFGSFSLGVGRRVLRSEPVR